MHFEQFYLGCLAHASYLVGDGGEAAIVDPQRDVERYLEAARARGLRIAHVIETHLHADFVSGHRELAERTGARIYLGPGSGAQFSHVEAREGTELRMGRVRLRFLETPGHTPESVSVLVYDEAASTEPLKVLTGDTLFVGDVGRPDLVAGLGHGAEEMAGLLYDSLHGKLLALPDAVEVWPAHGAGSACGRAISEERSSTIGDQRRHNEALAAMDRAEFVRRMTSDLPTAPRYFSHDAEANRRGARALADLPAPRPLAPAEVQALARQGGELVDVREADAFAAGHLPGALNVGLSGLFASWSGVLLSFDRPLVLIADDREGIDEAYTRLARIGLERLAGYLDGGVEAWRAAGLPLERIAQLDVGALRARLPAVPVLDVRRPAEFRGGHIPGAVNVPLDQLEARLAELPAGSPLAVACASGYRSSAACALLLRAGRDAIVNVAGGTRAWIDAGLPLER